MKVLVCGSRLWTDPWLILAELRKLPSDVTIIHGGARGADRLGGTMAEGIGLKVIEVPAEWGRYGRSAGPIRNQKMLDMKPDLVLAFHEDRGLGKGTAHMVRIARKAGVEVRVYNPPLDGV